MGVSFCWAAPAVLGRRMDRVDRGYRLESEVVKDANPFEVEARGVPGGWRCLDGGY